MNTPLAFAFILFAVVLAFAVFHIGFRRQPHGPSARKHLRTPDDQIP